MARFEEGVGRIMYVVGALELERPFLGPLYWYMSPQTRNTVQRVPGYVRFFLRYLADQIKPDTTTVLSRSTHPCSHRGSMPKPAATEQASVAGSRRSAQTEALTSQRPLRPQQCSSH